ncbi:hypothetical protein CVD28_26830 [Bacillus sp. M6-12]|uniref:hypothetical protein n=1 Tax=Bacillus sp. M6-12 TaxID=2054166 RepID=UPI000C7914CA|nr:hypothetical protein [Bacillus sp. M6-12]PLS14668.1 hypothetical protein CVD28_26830 [Bacillus sp. M6-12]
MADNRQNRNASCIAQSLENQEYAPGVDARATCDNQAEAAENQAGSSGRFGTEFSSVENTSTRKL